MTRAQESRAVRGPRLIAVIGMMVAPLLVLLVDLDIPSRAGSPRGPLARLRALVSGRLHPRAPDEER